MNATDKKQTENNDNKAACCHSKTPANNGQHSGCKTKSDGRSDKEGAASC